MSADYTRPGDPMPRDPEALRAWHLRKIKNRVPGPSRDDYDTPYMSPQVAAEEWSSPCYPPDEHAEQIPNLTDEEWATPDPAPNLRAKATRARDQLDEARAALARVREAVERHPDPCDKKRRGTSCGWKRAVIDVRAALNGARP